MAKAKKAAAARHSLPTAKSHKSRKTGVSAPPVGQASSSSTELTTLPASNPPAIPDANQTPENAEGSHTLPTEIEPKKQLWYRPADSKARVAFNKIAVLRTSGHDDREIAKKLKTTEGAVRQYVYLAKKNGWADDDGEPVDVEAEMTFNVERKIVRNISASLDGQMTNWQTHEMTLAAAKGRGIFKNHEKSEATVETMAVVAIKIEMPAIGLVDQQIDEKNVGGTPNYVEGEVVDGVN